jgi:hypothetical protein
MAALKKKRPLDGHVLNQNEISVKGRVQPVYNLKLEDFELEADYDAFLAEREQVFYNLVRNVNVQEMEDLLAAFKIKHRVAIERRNAEAMELGRLKGHVVLPLLAEAKAHARTGLGRGAKAVAMALTYSDRGFLRDIESRADRWEEHPEIGVERAGGMSEDWIYVKAKQGFRDSLVIPERPAL